MKRSVLALLAGLMALGVFAQDTPAKFRWRLNWHNDKPKIYTHRDPRGDLENFWYVTYDITNNTDQTVPVILDISLYAEPGKDLRHGVGKVDRDVIRDQNENPARSEEYLYGRFFPNVIVPTDAEYKIIEYDAKLSNRSQGIVEESIEKFKEGDEKFRKGESGGKRWYLNPREMRAQRVLPPGQSLHGVAIFRNVDARARMIELQVSGLVDIIRIEEVAEFETKMHYENHVHRIRYSFKGDEYDREADWLTFDRKDWMIRRLGPVSSKETLQALTEALLETYKRERNWADEGKAAADLDKARAENHITQLDTTIQARVFRLATGKDFGYDEDKDVLANEKAIWRMHEWWTTYQSRVIYNFGLNRFEVRDDKLPGEIDRDK